ncbi:BamA/TamA family outer membrane protein [Cytophagaceae bacterium ABcell3]|nr:BamA/TamA family outer membrane protein [Cytophagaceae bacterium ABcell3]
MKVIYNIFLYVACIVLICSCRVSKHLGEGEYLAYKQQIEGNSEVPRHQLANLYRQETNRRVLGTLPNLSMYYFGKSFYSAQHFKNKIASTEERFNKKLQDPDISEGREHRLNLRKEKRLEKYKTRLEEGNWIMRNLGEPPAIFDSVLVNETARQMTFFLHSKGHLHGHVKPKIDTSGRRVSITYQVVEKRPFKISKVNYVIGTKSIDTLVRENQHRSLIKVGENYNEQAISGERERLNRLMKNNGYYDFTRQFIHFEVDTSINAYETEIDVIIQNPRGQEHKKYTISNVYYNTDISTPPDMKDTIVHEGVHYIYNNKNFSKRILNNKLQIHAGDVFSQEKIQQTQRQLAMLDNYRFININFEKDRDTTTLTAFINTSPLKRFQLTDEVGVNVVTQAFIPGPFGNVSFRQRNVFGGFEILEFNVRGSIDGQASVLDPTNILRTLEYGGNVSLSFPEIYFPTKIRHRFHPYSPRTRFLTGYTMTDRPEFTRGNLKASMTYDWFPSINRSWSIAIADLNIINTIRQDDDFIRYLEDLEAQGNPLHVAFRRAFVSSMHASYVFNNQQMGENKKSRFIRLFAESGGTLTNFYNQFTPTEDGILGLQSYRFLKGSADFRYNFPIRSKSSFAMRFHGGMAGAYSEEGVLPYEKFFFGGGSNSVRAWHPRRLGPGSFADRDGDGVRRFTFEQPAEIIFETSFEYRFNMIGFLDGAVFIDAGNTWMIKEDETRPGSGFNPSEIAVGTGFGLRFNFSFLIARLDLGIKAWDPAEAGTDRFVLKQLVQSPPLGRRDQIVLNIGIGYPF